MNEFSDYIVYVDESGDHGLTKIDPHFPIFALSFCLLKKDDYIDIIVPAFQRFKFDTWGHDAVVLHESDIRKSKGNFAFLLTDSNLRHRFYDELSQLIETTPMTIFASVINKEKGIIYLGETFSSGVRGLPSSGSLKDIIPKEKHRSKYSDPLNPYRLSLLFCMERLLDWLIDKEQENKIVHIIFESRGKIEDKELQDKFRRICENREVFRRRNSDFSRIDFKSVFVKKAANATGLQLADLTARPIAIRQLRPDQPNRAADIIWPKIVDLKCFP